MFHPALQSGRSLSLLCAMVACLAPFGAVAAAATGGDQADRRAVYERDRAACESGKSTQERSLCLHDVSVAYRMPHTNKPYDLDPAAYQRNQALRCGPLKDKDLQDCMARMRGAGTTSGSVESGGMLRELTTVEVGKADAAADVKPAAKSDAKP